MAGKPFRLAFALAGLTLALAAPVAQAGQASVQDGVAVYVDNPGDSRALSWARDSGAIAITESRRVPGPAVSGSAGAGCTLWKANDVSVTYVCEGATSVRLELGDGDDFAEANNTHAFASPTRYFEDIAVAATVLGGDGNDEITGGPLDDALDGGAGNDTLLGNRASRDGGDTADALATDAMAGGPGNDTISGGKTIDGGDGDDIITGSRVGATIAGGAGKDAIQGGNGDDTIDGGPDADTIDGGDGANKLLGGDGDDALEGGEGADDIDGGLGADTVDGRIGKDRVAGGDGPDVLEGGPDEDFYAGGAGNDRLRASDEAQDVLDCGADADVVEGWDTGKDRAVPRASCEKVPEGEFRRATVIGYAKGARTGKLFLRVVCIDCGAMKVSLQSFFFWKVPRDRKFGYGMNCRFTQKWVSLKRKGFDVFEGPVPLNACQRRSLKERVAMERAHRAKFRRFTFDFKTPAKSGGYFDTTGKP